MATSKSYISYLLDKLSFVSTLKVRAMFGEYALYVGGVVVALICNEKLYIKTSSATSSLAKVCELQSPYPGAKLYYYLPDDSIDDIVNLGDILHILATEVASKKK